MLTPTSSLKSSAKLCLNKMQTFTLKASRKTLVVALKQRSPARMSNSSTHSLSSKLGATMLLTIPSLPAQQLTPINLARLHPTHLTFTTETKPPPTPLGLQTTQTNPRSVSAANSAQSRSLRNRTSVCQLQSLAAVICCQVETPTRVFA